MEKMNWETVLHEGDECGEYYRAEKVDSLIAELRDDIMDRDDTIDGYRETQPVLKEELANIANAKRFDRDSFVDDTAFADWAQSRARFTLDRINGAMAESGQPCP